MRELNTEALAKAMYRAFGERLAATDGNPLPVWEKGSALAQGIFLRSAHQMARFYNDEVQKVEASDPENEMRDARLRSAKVTIALTAGCKDVGDVVVDVGLVQRAPEGKSWQYTLLGSGRTLENHETAGDAVDALLDWVSQ